MSPSGYVEVDINPQTTRGRDTETGRFIAEVTAGAARAVQEAAQEGVQIARGIYAQSGYRWTLSFHVDGLGETAQIVAQGEWAEAAEFGIPAHFIAPHDPETHLYNEEDGFGPIWPAGAGVTHTGTQAMHMIQTAGTDVAQTFDQILIKNLP